MKTLFRGRFELKLDPKFRLTLPVPVRSNLETDKRLIMTNSQFQGRKCLDVHPVKEWELLEDRIARLPQLSNEVQNFQRFYLSGGHELDMDGHGRLLIPPALRQYANLQSEVIIVGMNEKFEIWDATVWKGLFENLAQDFPQTLNLVANLEASHG